MKWFAVAGGLMLTGLAGVVLADDKALKELEGTYTVVALEKNGKVPTNERLDSVQVVIKGDELTIVLTRKDDKDEKRAKIKVDATQTPHTIDIIPVEGEDRGKTFPGIYKSEKGELTIVFREGGDRPKEFKSDGGAMLRMKKENKK